jgi:hypothetical protein
LLSLSRLVGRADFKRTREYLVIACHKECVISQHSPFADRCSYHLKDSTRPRKCTRTAAGHVASYG